MFSYFQPKYVKFGRQFVKDAQKLLAYKCDLWSAEDVEEFKARIAALEKANATGQQAAIEEAAKALDKECGKHVSPSPDVALRENCEVFLVAIVIALAVRTYFLQPFTIPTGSMQPTLNGIQWHELTVQPPSLPLRIFQSIWLGRGYVNIVAKDDLVVDGLRKFKSLLPFVDRTPFLENFGFFDRTEILTDHGGYIIKENAESVSRMIPLGQAYRAGEPIARGYFDTGDHVFVDKFTYHFQTPTRGDVFVFNTQNLPTDENQRNEGGPSQFYIKRLAGLPGDQLRVDPPRLFVNGKPAEGRGFARVMSATNGYEGYQLGPLGGYLHTPGEVFPLPEKNYFAMGDNSKRSSDSRYWGTVPQQNIMGRGVFVYWPFSPHWGLIGR